MEYMSLRKWKIGLWVVLAVGLPCGATAMQWPDTAQETCYNNNNPIPCPAEKTADFHGQDAQFQGPTRSYTKLGHGGVELDDSATDWIMVRDNVTGLVWEVKENNDGLEDYNNPHDADNKYCWCDSTAEKPGRCNDSVYCPSDTELFLEALNSINFGGYSDWRMPTIRELSTLIYNGAKPLVDWTYFPHAKSAAYWSLTGEAENNNYSAWVMYFSAGTTYTYHKSANALEFNVRAVRGGL